MASIRWTAEAQRWLADIYEYIAADNPQAAAETVQGIYRKTGTFSDSRVASLVGPNGAKKAECPHFRGVNSGGDTAGIDIDVSIEQVTGELNA